jgi:hypothetical protein
MLKTANDSVFDEAFGFTPTKQQDSHQHFKRQFQASPVARSLPAGKGASNLYRVARDQQLQAEYDAERAEQLRINMIPAKEISHYAPSSLNSPTNYRSRPPSESIRTSLPSGQGPSLSIETSFGSPDFEDDMQFDGAQWSPKRQHHVATSQLQDAGDLPTAVPAAVAGGMSATLRYLSQLARKKNQRSKSKAVDTDKGSRGPPSPVTPAPRSRALDLFHGAAEYIAISGTAARSLAATTSPRLQVSGNLERALSIEAHAGAALSHFAAREGGLRRSELRLLGASLPAEVVNPHVRIQRHSSNQNTAVRENRGNLLQDALGIGQHGSSGAHREGGGSRKPSPHRRVL